MKGRTVILRYAAALSVIIMLVSISAKAAQAQDDPGAVYVLANQAANSVLVFSRAVDGTLSFSGNFATAGAGAGTGVDPLGSQGSLVLGRGHQRLFAVNAGSNDVSVFAVDGLNLELLDRASSGGVMPVSVAVHENLVYVVNAGGTPSIQGFFVEPSSGHLTPVPGSSQALPGGASASPGQIGISPDGDVLLVTEKGTNQIDTWTLTDAGLPVNGKVAISSGAVPFGFTFLRRDVALVTEAGPSALSSYEASDDGRLQLISETVPDTQKANCWVAATKNNRYAYVTNTGSGTISSYLISPDGSLRLLNATAAVTGPGTAPIDFALSNDSHFLLVRLGTRGMLAGFRVESDGSLTPVGSVNGVPAGAQGLAAR
jgi:6-phosphogluconolactonase (cycloisomerase 2 family)